MCHKKVESKDVGCFVYPSCLNCPRGRCVLDEELHPGRRMEAKALEIIRRYQAGERGCSIARSMDVRPSIVSKTISRYRIKARKEESEMNLKGKEVIE